MPVFRINIVFDNGKVYNEHHLVDGVELDTYYRRLLGLAQKAPVHIVSFDVVQVSAFSPVARVMRDNNIKRMSRYVPKMQPNQARMKRKRRF